MDEEIKERNRGSPYSRVNSMDGLRELRKRRKEESLLSVPVQLERTSSKYLAQKKTNGDKGIKGARHVNFSNQSTEWTSHRKSFRKFISDPTVGANVPFQA